jgi:hypothetical protein
LEFARNASGLRAFFCLETGLGRHCAQAPNTEVKA